MKSLFLFLSLASIIALASCSKEPADFGVGDAGVSSGTGGEGGGVTGTQGDAGPSENPAANAPNSNGTGTDAPN